MPSGEPEGPRVSVIIPTYNRAELLEQCLAGLEAQTYRDFEAVVAVDGSTDGTFPLLASVKRRSPFPLVDLYLTHGGRSHARNAAMRAARAPTLVLCDDDVVLGPETLALHAAFHDVHEQSVAVGPLTFTEGGTRFTSRPTWVNLTGANASLPRDFAEAAGWLDEELASYGGEDLEFGYRLAKAGASFRPLQGATATHLGPRTANPEKARSAGRQAVLIAAKHGPEVGLQLGVHPTLLNVKRAYLNPFFDRLVGRNSNYAFERAYLEGAREALAEMRGGAAGDDAAPEGGNDDVIEDRGATSGG